MNSIIAILTVVAVTGTIIPYIAGDLFPKPRLIDGRIVGGEIVDIVQVPYQISLLYNGFHICGGSLISKTKVLSAAHCVHKQSASMFSIRTGSSRMGFGGKVVKVTNITVHPLYNPRNVDYDFSILELEDYDEKHVKQSFVSLPGAGDELEDGTMLMVSGWGNTKNSSESNSLLRAVKVPKFNQEKCNRAYQIYGGVTERMICAGFDKGGKDACQGDSGGPLVDAEHKTLVGVVSWGYGCAVPNYPGIYSKVSSVRDWIKENSGV